MMSSFDIKVLNTLDFSLNVSFNCLFIFLRFNTNKNSYLRTSIVNYNLDNIFTCTFQDSLTILKIYHNEINSWLMRLIPAAFFVATQNDQLHVYAYPLYLYIACTVCHYILRCFVPRKVFWYLGKDVRILFVCQNRF